jgi:hypothetical protein
MDVSNILAGSTCRICQCLRTYQHGSRELCGFLTLFTTIPPSEWQMNIKGLLEALANYKYTNLAWIAGDGDCLQIDLLPAVPRVFAHVEGFDQMM